MQKDSGQFSKKLFSTSRFTIAHPPQINLDIKTGELLIVVGEVGSGKSSLLAAILGELKPFGPFGAGSHEVRGSVAYTAQDPWIQNLTLKDNVIMGAELDEEK